MASRMSEVMKTSRKEVGKLRYRTKRLRISIATQIASFAPEKNVQVYCASSETPGDRPRDVLVLFARCGIQTLYSFPPGQRYALWESSQSFRNLSVERDLELRFK